MRDCKYLKSNCCIWADQNNAPHYVHKVNRVHGGTCKYCKCYELAPPKLVTLQEALESDALEFRYHAPGGIVAEVHRLERDRRLKYALRGGTFAVTLRATGKHWEIIR